MGTVLKTLERKMKEAQDAGNTEEYERLSDLWQSLELEYVEQDMFKDFEVSEEEREANGKWLQKVLDKRR